VATEIQYGLCDKFAEMVFHCINLLRE